MDGTVTWVLTPTLQTSTDMEPLARSRHSGFTLALMGEPLTAAGQRRTRTDFPSTGLMELSSGRRLPPTPNLRNLTDLTGYEERADH
jgi:hypothetical protein